MARTRGDRAAGENARGDVGLAGCRRGMCALTVAGVPTDQHFRPDNSRCTVVGLVLRNLCSSKETNVKIMSLGIWLCDKRESWT